MSLVSLAAIRAARERIADRILVTPTLPAASLSAHVGASVFCKYESLQLTGSFKARGAFNHMLSLDDEQRARGVIAASAGNHAQGVAHAASSLGMRSTIVMPENTPVVKVDNTRAHGEQVEIVLEGADLSESLEHAWILQAEQGSNFVHPYDDDNIIAGQGTAGLELLEAVPDLDAVVIPIGGGGLISGMSAAIHHLRPEIDIYGVQTAAAPAMKLSREAGKLVAKTADDSIAEGIAVKAPGERNLRHVQAYVRDIALVEEAAIEAAIVDQMRQSQIVLEGAGAAVVAAALGPLRTTLAGRRVALVLSGGNIDLARLTPMIERSLARSNRLVQLRAQISDRPGGLVAVLSVIADVRGNVVHVVHDRVFSGSRFGETEIEVTLEVRSEEHERKIVQALLAQGYAVTHVGHVPHPGGAS